MISFGAQSPWVIYPWRSRASCFHESYRSHAPFGVNTLLRGWPPYVLSLYEEIITLCYMGESLNVLFRRAVKHILLQHLLDIDGV